MQVEIDAWNDYNVTTKVNGVCYVIPKPSKIEANHVSCTTNNFIRESRVQSVDVQNKVYEVHDNMISYEMDLEQVQETYKHF